MSRSFAPLNYLAKSADKHMGMNTNTPTKMAATASGLDRPLRVLHLEDDPDDRHVIQEWFKQQNIRAEFTDADNEADFVKACEEGSFDIVLSDKSLPGFDGLSALRFVREKFPHLPFVFVTGSMGEESAIETMKDGATDYVLKDRLSRLIPAVQRAIRESEREKKNRQIEEKIRQQAALLDKAQDAILVTDVDSHILFWNKSAERIYGWPISSVMTRKASEILPTNKARYEEVTHLLLARGSWTGELTAANRGGNELIVESRWTLVRDELGIPKSILIIDTDITEKKALEAKFLRSQRMDSIGALAGGIAHDLNNALAPVIIGADLLKTCEDDIGREKFLDIISTNAQRATGLVKQILGFARGSGGQSGPIKLSHLITEMGKMIQDTFSKAIALSVKLPDKELWTVLGDTTELHQVLLNLCVNARDAMPNGGSLALSAKNVTLDELEAMANGATPGAYVMVSVADTGSGIPPEVLPRIFEPFFTTKTGDKGTGLGLATVSGIVKHHGGFIDIQTKSGKGTEFRVYIPAMNSAATAAAETKEAALPVGHGELILVIDDEESVRELTKTTLESYGYRVVTAQNGLQGIARFKENPNDIKLIATDTDMPYVDGLGAIRAIKELKPDIPVIIASGGSKSDTDEIRKVDSAHVKNLAKPYSLDQLLVAVAMGLQH
jgi:two-component system, cell cycle sensor histidine kinase and response regulator CckA